MIHAHTAILRNCLVRDRLDRLCFMCCRGWNQLQWRALTHDRSPQISLIDEWFTAPEVKKRAVSNSNYVTHLADTLRDAALNSEIQSMQERLPLPQLAKPTSS